MGIYMKHKSDRTIQKKNGGAFTPPFNMNWQKAAQTAATPALFAWGAKHLSDKKKKNKKGGSKKKRGGAFTPPFNINWQKAAQTAATPALFAWGAKHLSEKRKKNK